MSSVVPLILRRMDANTMLPGRGTELELAFYKLFMMMKHAAMRAPPPSTRELQLVGLCFGYSSAVCCADLLLNFAKVRHDASGQAFVLRVIDCMLLAARSMHDVTLFDEDIFESFFFFELLWGMSVRNFAIHGNCSKESRNIFLQPSAAAALRFQAPRSLLWSHMEPRAAFRVTCATVEGCGRAERGLGVDSDGTPPPLDTTALRRASLALSQEHFKPTYIVKPALEVRWTGRNGLEDASHTAPSRGRHQANTRWSFRVVHCAPFASRRAPVPYHCNLQTRRIRRGCASSQHFGT